MTDRLPDGRAADEPIKRCFIELRTSFESVIEAHDFGPGIEVQAANLYRTNFDAHHGPQIAHAVVFPLWIVGRPVCNA